MDKILTQDKVLAEFYVGGDGWIKVRAQTNDGGDQIGWLDKEKSTLLYNFLRANIKSSKESLIYV